MQRRDLLKLMTGLSMDGMGGMGATMAGDMDDLAFPPVTDNRNSLHQLMYLHPGELTFLLGRPKNGKTTLAMSIALEYAQRGASVWYFSMGRNSQAIAAMMGLDLKQFENGSERVWRERHYHAYANGRRLPLTFFDHFFATNTSLTQVLYGAGDFSVSRPQLVVYDGEDIDCTALTEIEEYSMAADLARRRTECSTLFKAPIIITLDLPSGEYLQREDKRPLEEELTPRPNRRPKNPLVDEVYFVHRQALYEEESSSDTLDAIELIRVNRLRPENHTRLLVRDTQTKRLRNLDHGEVEHLFGNRDGGNHHA